MAHMVSYIVVTFPEQQPVMVRVFTTFAIYSIKATQRIQTALRLVMLKYLPLGPIIKAVVTENLNIAALQFENTGCWYQPLLLQDGTILYRTVLLNADESDWTVACYNFKDHVHIVTRDGSLASSSTKVPVSAPTCGPYPCPSSETDDAVIDYHSRCV